MIMSLTLIKTIINRRCYLNDSFEEILNLLDIWINEGSGWIIDKDYRLTSLTMNHY